MVVVVHLKYLLLLSIQISRQWSSRSASRFCIIICNVASMTSGTIFRVIVVKLIHLKAFEYKKLVLDIERATSLMSTQLSWFQSVLTSPSASLSMQMLPQVVVRRLDLFAILIPVLIFVCVYRTVPIVETMTLIHMIDIVLLMHILSILIFENLSQNAFSARRL